MRSSLRRLFTLLVSLSLVHCGGQSKPPDSGNSTPGEMLGDAGTSKYSVILSVVGLRGTGLKLDNNGETLDVSSTGDIAFPTMLAPGSVYNVTVVAQPTGPWQHCELPTSKGPVEGGNVHLYVFCDPLPFRVGGTVSGVQGVVELSNGTETLRVNDGKFHFFDQVLSGTAYAVQLTKAPSTQDCTLEHGTGTVRDVDVTDITVRCVTRTHRVNAVVSGLMGSVTLTNDDMDELVITQNGTQAFTTPVAEGDYYRVEVLTQPATQTCTVEQTVPLRLDDADVSVNISCVTHRYLLGGGVSGLSPGESLTLANGSDVLKVTDNGFFGLLGKVEQGSPYTVVVQTPPVGKHCYVVHGSSTMGNSDVLNVYVECIVNTYGVGGTITGLGIDRSITLLDTAGIERTLYENGPFSFAAYREGSSYDITVSNQPPGQRCIVTNGSGTGLTSDVTNVAVTCVNYYTVSGNVTGLGSGRSLVVTNSGLDELTLAGTSSGELPFTFVTAVKSGTLYQVSVKKQPPGTLCSVSNGLGYVGTDNVTNVSIVCTDIRYTVGGQVTGLTSGKTLVLTDNGGDDLGVMGPSNGSVAFTFASAVASGKAYVVAVKTQPAGGTCTVLNGSGTLGTSNVTSVAVSCAFSPRVVVVRVGSGSETLNSLATPVFLETYEVPGGTLVSTTPVPTGMNGLTLSGTAGSEGFLSRSSDGHSVVLAGYGAGEGAPVVTATSTDVPRVVGRMDALGTFSVVAKLTNAFSGGNVRAATTEDGRDYWVCGNSSATTGGIHYVLSGSLGGSLQVLDNPNNVRAISISASQLHMSTGSGPNKPIYVVGSSLPKTTGQTPMGLPGLPSFSAPYQFFFMDRDPSIPGDDILYVADDNSASGTGGVFKFVKDSSGTWNAAPLANPGAARGVAAVLDGSTVRVVAILTPGTSSGPATAVTFVDDGTSTATVTTLFTSPSNTSHRGVAPAPSP